MTRKQIIRLVLIGGMLLVAVILALGDLTGGKKQEQNISVIHSVNATVQANSITLAVTGDRQSCDIISNWEQKRRQDLISVTPVFERLSDVSCDETIPFEESVVVDVGNLPAGSYRFDVLGTTTTVTLQTAITPFSFASFSSATFKNFPIEIKKDLEKAPLDVASFADFGNTAQLQSLWQTAQVNLADRFTVLTISCGPECFRHAIVDITNGTLVHIFNSSHGIESQAGSLLVIVNSPDAIKASGTTDAVVAEAYMFDTNSQTFRFIAQGDYLLGELH